MTPTSDNSLAFDGEDRGPLRIVESISFSSGAAVITVRGEVDMLTAPQLQDALADAAVQTMDIVVDLSAVTFFSTAGAHVVTNAHNARPAQVRVFAPTDPARCVLDMVG